MPDPAEPPLQPADVLAMLRRRRWIALAAGILAILAVAIAPRLLQPPMHRAEATLSASRGIKPLELEGKDPLTGLVPEQMVNTQRELLTSKTVLENALAMGGLLAHPPYAGAADPVEILQSRLRTAVVKNSWVINIALDDEDPVRAEGGLQALLDAFLSHQTSLRRARTEADLAYIAQQRTAAAARLAEAREAERAYRATHGIAGTDPDNNHITARIRNLAERQASLDERLAASSAQVSRLREAERLAEPAQRRAALMRIDTVVAHTVFGTLQNEVFALEGQEAELAAKFLDKHPRLIEVRSHLAAKRTQLDGVIASIRTSIEAEHQGITEQRTALVAAMGELHQELNAYREKLVALQSLSLESTVRQRLHDELATRHAQISALAAYDDRRMVIEAPPRASAVAPKLAGPGLLILALLAGLAAAVGAGLAADAIDARLRHPAQVAALTGLPALPPLPHAPPRPLAESGAEDPPALAEAMRSLLAALRLRLPPAEGGRVIAVVSACGGDGRTTVSARLAAAMALSGLRTLLVDGDLRRPAIDQETGVAAPHGLAQILAGTPEVAARPGPLPNLSVMPAGEAVANPGELLHSHCLAEWLQWTRAHFDAVVVDTPPLAECPDALLLLSAADCGLLLTHLGATSRHGFEAAWRQLEPVRSRLSGQVVIGGAGAPPTAA